MPFIIEPVAQVELDSRIVNLAMSEDGSVIALALANGELRLHTRAGESVSILKPEGRAGLVRARQGGGFVMGTVEGDLHIVSQEGEMLTSYPLSGGVEALVSTEGLVACIDGTGTIHLLDSSCRAKTTLNRKNISQLVSDAKGRALALIGEDGSVEVVDSAGEVLLHRQPRADRGERVTAVCFDSAGHLVLARETLGLAAQDEDEVEVEWWTPLGERVGIQGLNTRCTCLQPGQTGVLAGTFGGEVMLMDRDEEPVQIWRSPYAISLLQRLGEDILVASWFNLYRIRLSVPEDAIEGDEICWEVEHQGIVEFLDLDQQQNSAVLGGEDRNDYTAEEPILVLDLNAEPRWEEEAQSDDGWGLEVQDEPKGEQAQTDEESYASLLTPAEQALLSEQVLDPDAGDDLLAALSGGIDMEEMATAPNDGMHADDLLAGMTEQVVQQTISPVANSGEDMNVEAEEDGTATVTLDGSATLDPSNRVERWLWRDSRGQEIGNTNKMRVKLAIGRHRFELSVLDDDGVWTTDTTFIVVE